MVTVKAYAKINLHLDICGIRNDGYHNVETVMQTVSLYDEVTVCFTEREGITCECNVEGVPTDERNIAVKAAILFAQKSGTDSGVHIKIDKNIPMAAGLAGGSADAAATLRALNILRGNIFTQQELCDIASCLGADVPFCLVGGCAYTDGKGDVLHNFPSIPKDTVFLVACGGEGVSTPWAYKFMDEVFDNFSSYRAKGVDSLRDALISDVPKEFASGIFNIFEAPVLERREVAKQIKATMLKGGAVAAMMSGSGPSVFGIFDNETDARLVEKKVKNSGYFAQVCYPVEI